MVRVQGIGALGAEQAVPVRVSYAVVIPGASLGNLTFHRVGKFVEVNAKLSSEKKRIPDGTVIMTIPEGFRPMSKIALSQDQKGTGHTNVCEMTIYPNGDITLDGGVYYGASIEVSWCFNEFYITNDSMPEGGSDMVTVNGIGAAGSPDAIPSTQEVQLISDLTDESFMTVSKIGNLVQLNCRIGAQTALGANTKVATLPEGYRPIFVTVLSHVQGGQEYCVLTITDDGDVYVNGGLAYGTSFVVYYTFNDFFITR